jgi:hypothetical protein
LNTNRKNQLVWYLQRLGIPTSHWQGCWFAFAGWGLAFVILQAFCLIRSFIHSHLLAHGHVHCCICEECVWAVGRGSIPPSVVREAKKRCLNNTTVWAPHVYARVRMCMCVRVHLCM